ncbi:glutathione S-transferase family protein [Thalassospira indica]|uniref:Glutathione S-transferase family protein n=1 Tax=Thalassospira indica TaxID=1891279 RepID=A0ABN5NLV4_9PROT|nr:glutathione S-transferase family protein [Thalassospira indica]AXO17050.1 glutathione S-transferase family protein [Thalassospira indica]
MILNDYLMSGNGYKVRLLLSMLGQPFEYVERDIMKGETHTPEYLEKVNPNGKIPALVLDDGRTLAESNAILIYLAEGTNFIPEDAYDRADMMSWLFFEQYDHEPNVAVLISWYAIKGLPEHADILEPMKQAGAKRALDLMEKRLSGHNWLVGDALTIADISLYAYTHRAELGKISLAPYPGIRAWLDRMTAVPGYVPITWTP